MDAPSCTVTGCDEQPVTLRVPLRGSSLHDPPLSAGGQAEPLPLCPTHRAYYAPTRGA